MTDKLRKAMDCVCEGGPLLGVDIYRFQRDPNFVTAVRFRFEGDAVTFLAVADDDTVTAECGPVSIDDEGVWVDVSEQPVWSECVGGHAPWAWYMKNQQGYIDGVRIEFEMADRNESRIVEFVIVASAFRFFAARKM